MKYKYKGHFGNSGNPPPPKKKEEERKEIVLMSGAFPILKLSF